MYSSSVIQFKEQPLELLEVDGQRCLTAETIGKALDYSEPRKQVNKLFNRSRDEFEKEVDYSVVKLTTEAGERETTVFFQTGVMLISMFSQQPLAKDFRQWAKHVLAAVQYGFQNSQQEKEAIRYVQRLFAGPKWREPESYYPSPESIQYLQRINILQEELLALYRREKREEEERPFHEPYEPIRPEMMSASGAVPNAGKSLNH